MRLIRHFWHIVALLGVVSRLTNATSSSPRVNLGYAEYRGTGGAGVDRFLGMRYAAPPTGSLRFRRPQDPKRQQLVQDATRFGPVCVGAGESVTSSRGEDCLFVNVFKPSEATEDSRLPVWVFIQGGSYAFNSQPNYDGSEVVRQSGKGLVFVNFNYRVGALGFLASSNVQHDGDLNAGLLDQRKLLRWVQTHISKFGGDPNHVVIHGASAGAGSVLYHMTAYGAAQDDNLFVGAIPESPFLPTQRTVLEMEFQYNQLLANTGCQSLACLRNVDTRTFISAASYNAFPGASYGYLPLWYWLPVVDGSLVPDQLYALFDQGKFLRKPVLVGDDTNEGSWFGYEAVSPGDVMIFIQINYPHLDYNQLARLTDFYPRMDPLPYHSSYFPSASAAYGDCTFICPGVHISSSVAKFFDPQQSWSYRYNVIDPDNVANGVGVPHVFETSAIFGLGFADYLAASYYTTNAAIVPVTMNYYISFVRALDPNTYKLSSAPRWDSWGQGRGQRMRLQMNNTAMEYIPQDLVQKCAYWKNLASTMEI